MFNKSAFTGIAYFHWKTDISYTDIVHMPVYQHLAGIIKSVVQMCPFENMAWKKNATKWHKYSGKVIGTDLSSYTHCESLD